MALGHYDEESAVLARRNRGVRADRVVPIGYQDPDLVLGRRPAELLLSPLKGSLNIGVSTRVRS